MIAQAFQSIRYPILPDVTHAKSQRVQDEILKIRHSSLFVPRDFDLSPYFAVVKPTLESGFDYRQVRWETNFEPGSERNSARVSVSQPINTPLDA